MLLTPEASSFISQTSHPHFTPFMSSRTICQSQDPTHQGAKPSCRVCYHLKATFHRNPMFQILSSPYPHLLTSKPHPKMGKSFFPLLGGASPPPVPSQPGYLIGSSCISCKQTIGLPHRYHTCFPSQLQLGLIQQQWRANEIQEATFISQPLSVIHLVTSHQS